MWLIFVELGGLCVGVLSDQSNGGSGSLNDVLTFFILIMKMFVIFEK